MKLKHTLVVIDLETTGTWVEKDKIVEIGMIKVSTQGTKESYVQRVNPEIPIPTYVSRLIGISNEDVQDAPCFREIAEEILFFIDDADIGGFNLERFDLPILQREIIHAGFRFDWQERVIYDAQKIYHVNEKRDLTAAFQFYCNKRLINAHSALGDAEATLEILSAQAVKYGSEDSAIEDLQSFQYEHPAEYFDEDKKFRWWNKNLYPMFGKYARRYSIKKIAEMDSAYLEWILKRDFSDKIKVMIEGVLSGQYPVYPDTRDDR